MNICEKCNKSYKPTRYPQRFCSSKCWYLIATKNIEQSFWEKVIKTNKCWKWNGAKSLGYGVFGASGKTNLKAHRISWKIHNGKIPKGMWVLHKCDNPECVNPKHLYLGNAQDNSNDMKERTKINRGEKNHFAKLKEYQVLDIKKLLNKNSTYQEMLKIADEFKVSWNMIYRIKNGYNWEWLKK